MEQDVKLGQVGSLDIKLEGGKASVTVSVSVPDAALKASASVEMDGSELLDKLLAAIEAKSPPGVIAIEEGVKSILHAALAKV